MLRAWKLPSYIPGIQPPLPDIGRPFSESARLKSWWVNIRAARLRIFENIATVHEVLIINIKALECDCLKLLKSRGTIYQTAK